MRIHSTIRLNGVLGLALLAAPGWHAAHAAEIAGVRLVAGATGTRAELAIATSTDYKIISLANPDRLVVDLPGAELGKAVVLPAPAGLIKAVRSGHPVPGTTRIVFDLKSSVVPLKPRFETGAHGSQLVLEWPGDDQHDAIAGIAAAAAQTGATPAAAPLASTTPASTSASSEPVARVAEPKAGSAAAVAAAKVATAGGSPTVDPALASAAATSRLVASTVPPVVLTPAPVAVASPPVAAASVVAAPLGPVQTSAAPSLSTAMQEVVPAPGPVAAADLPSVSQPIGRIATGVPTRIATGVPTPLVTPEAPPPAGAAIVQRPSRGIALRPLIIAIDPGHGGQDPGAVGLQGKREKDVTLAIGRELARQIDATPGLKSYMTRDTDRFIPLNQRAQLARAARADIFVSIHADAADNRSARGSSVYVLSLKGASSQRARWLADKENSADLIGGRVATIDNTLASVLLDLTQSGHMKASEDAADHVLTGLRQVGSNHKPQIERANFAVLRTSDMPSMLVETAFISNPDEERRLTDPSSQRELARAILGGIDDYFQQQPPPGTLYASRAAATGRSGGGSP